MGTWGSGLFDDDIACDVRKDFRDFIGDGLSPAQAVRAIRKQWEPDDWDTMPYASFWLAIAVTAWNLGRLTNEVKRRALAILDKGVGLEHWADAKPSQRRKRLAVYRLTRKKLLSPQPLPKKVPQKKISKSPFKPGDVVRYTTVKGRFIYLRVLAISPSKDQSAVCDICQWKASYPPPVQRLGRIPRQKPLPQYRIRQYPNGLMSLYGSTQKFPPADRTMLYARRVKFDEMIAYNFRGGSYFGGWPQLDEYLKSEFGIA